MTQISNVAMMRQAQALYAQQRYDEAIAFCQELLRRQVNHPEALTLLIDISWRLRDRQQAFAYAQRLARAAPNDATAIVKLADLHNRVGQHKEAVRILARFRRKVPKDLFVLAALARSTELCGDIDAAVTLLEPHIRSGVATPVMAHQYAAICLDRKEYAKVIEIETQLAQHPSTPSSLREAALFLLGQAYERSGDFDRAFAAYSAANSVIPRTCHLQEIVDAHNEIIDVFSAARLKLLPKARHGSTLPVYIVCRPRSGSTLIERIIATHPSAAAAGELETLTRVSNQLNLLIGSTAPYPQSVADMDQNDVDHLGQQVVEELQAVNSRASRITNKSLDTWRHLGLVALLCPQARVIDLRRDPIDNGLAIFAADIHTAQRYDHDLTLIGHMQREYERLMAHWYAVLDLPILRVNYEDLVADQEYWSRKIIEHCGLEWDDRCLRFYEKGAQQSSSAAPTLSHQQVRQPIYKSSVSRAAKFMKHLRPLYEGLGLEYPGDG